MDGVRRVNPSVMTAPAQSGKEEEDTKIIVRSVGLSNVDREGRGIYVYTNLQLNIR